MSSPQTTPAAPAALTGVAGVHDALVPAGLLGGGAVGASALDAGGVRLALSQKTVERFWAKVSKADPGCWTWTASTNPHGYGQFMLPGQRLARAHRLSWEFTNGPIPEGVVVCHRCDNPPCVNPAHLFLGTQLDNIADMHAKGRASGGRNGRPGSENPNAKISADDVLRIRQLQHEGLSGRQIARQYGLSPAQVGRIITGKRWGHL